MARKRYASGYPEKLIYDNTVFHGISATTDPNPEGYFKQLINFDISDTGQSLQPRKGFLNTSLHTYDSETDTYPYVDLNYDTTIYYLDHETNNYFFIDFSKYNYDDQNDTYATFIYNGDISTLNEETKYFIVEPVTNYVIHRGENETLNYLNDVLTDIEISTLTPTSTHSALYAKDDILVDRNVIKVYYTTTELNESTGLNEEIEHPIWIEFKYNSTNSSMLITVLKTDDTVALDMANRNIASSASLVPDPIAVVYDNINDATADGKTYSQFPMIYKSKDTGSNKKYLLNYTDSLDGLKIEPSYYLLPPEDGYKWVYTYDILSTSNITKQFSSYTEEELKQLELSKYIIYQAPVFNLDDNTNIFEKMSIGAANNTESLFNIKYNFSELITNYLIGDNNLDSTHTGVISDTDQNNLVYINSSSVLSGGNYIGSAILSDNKNTNSLINTSSVLDDYIFYIVPKNNTAPSTYDSTNNTYSYSVEFNNISDLFGSTIDPMKLLNKLFIPSEDDMYYNKYGEQEYCIPIISSIAEQESNRLYNIYSNTLDKSSSFNISDFINFAKEYKNDFEYYVEKIGDAVNRGITNDGATLYNCGQTALSSGLLIWDTEPISYDELYENYLKQYDKSDINSYDRPITITVKPMFTRCKLNIYNNVLTMLHIWYNNAASISTTTNSNINTVIKNIELYFPNLFEFALKNEFVFKDNVNSLITYNGAVNNTWSINNTSTIVAKTYYIYTSCTSSSIYNDLLNTYINYTRNEDDKFILNMLCGYGEYINKSATSSLNTVVLPNISITLGSSASGSSIIDISSYDFTTSYLYNKPTFNTNNCGRTIVGSFYNVPISIDPKNSITLNRYKTLFTYDNTIESIFSNVNGVLSLHLYDSDKYVLSELNKLNFFSNGISIVLYFSQIYTTGTITSSDLSLDPSRVYARSYIVASTILQNNTSIQLRSNSDNDKRNQIDVYLDGDNDNNDPAIIKEGKDWCMFYSVEGYRLVTWSRNFVYMSEPSQYYYFKEDNKKAYSERVIKVLPFKDMLLVFTTQNMYSIFPYEYTTTVQDGVDDEGNAKYVQQKTVVYNTLPVLYNLYTDERYKDVIQVYNGMVLFYSADGQLYLISPSTQIDSDTQFSIKYINKTANDILLNYDKYINQRLNIYYNSPDLNPVSKDNDDIVITASVSISQIKIYYTVPKYTYTYILIYDITNNRYTVYDTPVFGTVQEIIPTELYETIITRNATGNIGAVIPYTEPNVPNNNCDLSSIDNFVFIQHDILTELDTGIIQLNNQWKKRFRSLKTTYKNLDANDILFDLSVLVDDIYISSTMGDVLILKNINSQESDEIYYLTEQINNATNLVKHTPESLIQNIPVNKLTPSAFLQNNTKLFDFSAYSSNKIITHNTNIPSVGKYIDLQLRFKSKGKYKLQSFTLVYKEHSS